MTTHLSSTAAVDELLGQVFEEPGVHADALDGDAVAGVGLEDLAYEIHALPRQRQVGREAVLHSHDALQPQILPSLNNSPKPDGNA